MLVTDSVFVFSINLYRPPVLCTTNKLVIVYEPLETGDESGYHYLWQIISDVIVNVRLHGDQHALADGKYSYGIFNFSTVRHTADPAALSKMKTFDINIREGSSYYLTIYP